MQRTIIDLPEGLCPLVSDWVFNVRGQSAGDGVDGSGQVRYGQQGRWEATMTLPGRRSERVRALNAFRARMRGRVNVARVRIGDAFGPTFADMDINRGAFDRGVPGILSGKPFGTGTVADDFEPTIAATAAYPAGAETIAINTSSIHDALKEGHYLSHNDWPVIIVKVEGSGAATVLTIEPPLRRPIPNGATIKLRATALMAFETDLEGRLALQMGKRGEAVFNLVEWVNRP